MDYLEGALLGKLWSDTDYENKRHWLGPLLGYGLFWLYALYLIYRQNFVGTPVVILLFFVWFILAAVLMLLSPVCNYLYYSLALPLRIVILIGQALKFVFAHLFLYALFVPFVHLDPKRMAEYAMQVANGVVSTALQSNMENFSVTSMVFKLIGVSLLGLVGMALVFLLLGLIPWLYMKLLRFIQYTIDQMLLRLMQVRGRGPQRVTADAAGRRAAAPGQSGTKARAGKALPHRTLAPSANKRKTAGPTSPRAGRRPDTAVSKTTVNRTQN